MTIEAEGFEDARRRARNALEAANDQQPGYRWPGVLGVWWLGLVLG